MRTCAATLSVLALASVALAHSQPDSAPRFDLLSHSGGAPTRMRLRHKRQLEVGAPGGGSVSGGDASAASASVNGAAQQQSEAAGAASTNAAAVASTQPATTSANPRATTTPAAPATPSSSAQAAATSAPAASSSSGPGSADETSSSAPAAAQTSTQTSSSAAALATSSSSSASTTETSRVTRTVISSDAQSVETSTSTQSASQSSASASSTASSSAASSAASASASTAALNSDGKDSSSSGGFPKPALIAIIVVGSVLVSALAIWYVIRKTALSPSKRFEKRLRSELDFSPSPTDPDLNDHDSYEPDDAHLVPGTLAHARNISGMSNDRPYGMAGQGVAPGYASSLARSDSGKNSLPGTPPQMSEG